MDEKIYPSMCVVHVGDKTVNEFGKFWVKEIKEEKIEYVEKRSLFRIIMDFIIGIVRSIIRIIRSIIRKPENTTIVPDEDPSEGPSEDRKVRMEPIEDVIPFAVISDGAHLEYMKKSFRVGSGDESTYAIKEIAEHVGDLHFNRSNDLKLLMIISDLDPVFLEFSFKLLRDVEKYPFKKVFMVFGEFPEHKKKIMNLFSSNNLFPIVINDSMISRNNFQRLFREIPDFLRGKYLNYSQRHIFSFPEFLPSPYNSEVSAMFNWIVDLDSNNDEEPISKAVLKALGAVSILPIAWSFSDQHYITKKHRVALIIPQSPKINGGTFEESIVAELEKMRNVDRFDLLSKKEGYDSLVWMFGTSELEFDSLEEKE
jgi:hypothetical protein